MKYISYAFANCFFLHFLIQPPIPIGSSPDLLECSSKSYCTKLEIGQTYRLQFSVQQMQLTAAMQKKRATIAQTINHTDVEPILLGNETILDMRQKSESD